MPKYWAYIVDHDGRIMKSLAAMSEGERRKLKCGWRR